MWGQVVAGVQRSLCKQANIFNNSAQIIHQLLVLCHFSHKNTVKISDQSKPGHVQPYFFGSNALIKSVLIVDGQKSLANNAISVPNLALLDLGWNTDVILIVDHRLVDLHDAVQTARLLCGCHV